jgi:hypothetical protein
MHRQPHSTAISIHQPIPFTDEEVGNAAHEKHMPSVRAIAVDPDRGLVLLNLVGADASVSAVVMELLRSKSNGVGFLPSLFGSQLITIPTQISIQSGIRYSIFRSALATAGGSITLKNWCLLISTANIAESRRRAPSIPAQLLPPPASATTEGAPAVPADKSGPPPHYVIRSATTAAPDPDALLGHLRAIGVVLADDWAATMRDLALDAQLVMPIPTAGVSCWRIDGDLLKWVDLVKQGIQFRRFTIPVQTALPQQRAA